MSLPNSFRQEVGSLPERHRDRKIEFPLDKQKFEWKTAEFSQVVVSEKLFRLTARRAALKKHVYHTLNVLGTRVIKLRGQPEFEATGFRPFSNGSA